MATINNVRIKDSKTFLNTFYFADDTYSADAIDKKVDASVIDFCIKEKQIQEITRNDKRLYVILPEGKRAIGRK